MELYQHQREAVEGIEGSFLFGSKNVVLSAATSFGKSLVLSTLAKDLEGKVVILVNITALINQIAEHLDEIGCDYSILKAGKAYEPLFDPSKKIQLVMSQTYYARADSIDFGDVSYICQDEAHREWKTQRTLKILNDLNPIGRLGVSGTPFDEEGYALEDMDALINTITIKELENQGYLCPVKYYIPKWAEQIDYSELRKSGSDYSGEALDELINTNEHTDMIVKSMNQMDAKNKKTIVFANSIEHCDRIADALIADGYDAFSYHSKNNKTSEAHMESFRTDSVLDEGLIGSNNKIMKCCVSVSKITTGFSVKNITLGVICRASKVKSLVAQSIGRLVRTYPGKEYAEVLDLAQVVKLHGFHDEPYLPPKRGNKKELADAKALLESPIIGSIVGEEPMEVDREMINIAVKELKRKEQTVKTLETKDLMALFEISTNDKKILEIGYEMNKRIRGTNYNEGTLSWATKTWIEFIDEYPEFKSRIIKSCKTRIKNIVKDAKNMNSIRYFPEFLISKPPYTYKRELDEFVISDDEIPF